MSKSGEANAIKTNRLGHHNIPLFVICLLGGVI